MHVFRQFQRRSESLVLRMLGVAVLLVGCSRGNSGSIPVASAAANAGQYFSDFGSYLSPGRTKLVAISSAPTGGMSLHACENNVQQVPSDTIQLPSGAWFAVWNETDELFVFVDGEADDDRVIKWSKDAQFGINGTTFVGEGGGWEGVPEDFVAKLPDRWHTMYETWRNKDVE